MKPLISTTCFSRLNLICISVIMTGFLTACGSGSDSGGSIIPPPTNPPPTNPPVVNPPPSASISLTPVSSAESFESFLKLGLSQWAGTTGSPRAASLSAESDSAAPAQQIAGASQLNVQVAGVDEQDIARFDGEFFYVSRSNQIDIISADNINPSTAVVNTITLSDSTAVDGMYLLSADQQGSLLTVVASDFDYQWQEDSETPWSWRDGTTLIEVYNVDDPTNTSRESSLQIQGYLIDSRRIEDTLYLVTRATPGIQGLIDAPQTDEARASNQTLIDAAGLSDLLPSVIVDGGVPQTLVTPTDCLVPDIIESDLHYPSLVTVSAINLRDSTDIKSVCMAENAFAIYVSANAMYLISNNYPSQSGSDVVVASLIAAPSSTTIHKFAFTSNGPEYKGSGSVEGQLITGDPAYRMGEHNGRLAVVTSTSFNGGHRLTLLEEGNDLDLVKVGELPNTDEPAPIGKEGEAIYATRIIGDRAYIVTFLTIDPVYVIDLANLSILGELEIPGFSSYLHPVTEDLILGVGKSTVIEDGQAFFQGMKIQLFDVSDPANPVSASEVAIGLRGTDSALSYDPHALAYVRDFRTGIDRFAIPIAVHGDGIEPEPGTAASFFYDYSHTGLYLFELDKAATSINPMGALKQLDDSCAIGRERGYIVNDAVHFLRGDRLLSALWDSPDQTSELVLNDDNLECFFFTAFEG